MQPIKLIAVDLDGTLFDEKKQISPENLSALRRAAQRGVYVVVATGRIYRSAKLVSKSIAPGQPYLSSNGAVAGFADRDDFLHAYRMRDEDVSFTLDAAVQEGCELHLHTLDGRMLHLKTPAKRMQYAGESLASGSYGAINQLLDLAELKREGLGQTLKIVVMNQNEQQLNAFRRRMASRPAIVMASSWQDNEEIMAVGADKGSGLCSLARELSLPLESVMVLGDHTNDLSMFQVAGLPVAMGNATDDVKAAAKYITLDNEHSGVARAVEKFVL